MNRRQQMRRHTSDEAAIERHVREMLHEDRDAGNGTPPDAPSGDIEPEGAEDRS